MCEDPDNSVGPKQKMEGKVDGTDWIQLALLPMNAGTLIQAIVCCLETVWR